MSKLIKEISVFFPAYNEEGNIRKTIESAVKTLNKVAVKWEILIINDGSKDKTKEIAKSLAAKFKNVKLINHDINKGYGAAFKSGFYNAKYEWIALTDIDGQFDLSEITNFIAKLQESKADLVIGYYKKRQVPFFTVLTSKIWEAVVFCLFGLKVKDIDCGFKLVSKKVIDSIPKLESERGAFISSEFLIKARKKGFKIAEVPVTHYPRKSGKGTGRNLNVIIKSFIDLAKLWIKLNLG